MLEVFNTRGKYVIALKTYVDKKRKFRAVNQNVIPERNRVKANGSNNKVSADVIKAPKQRKV